MPAASAVSSAFLGRLPPAQRKPFVAACTRTELKAGKVLTKLGERLTHVYFPIGAYVSQVMTIERRDVEIGLVGNEGMYGVHAGMGIAVSPLKAIVQGAGPALRMSLKEFQSRLARSAALQELVSRYTYFIYQQAVHSAACNRFHLMEQRLSRWLLNTADRAQAPRFTATQQLLAAMLGSQRAGVNEAARELQARDLIRYRRGLIAILDRKGLEELACPCYRADRRQFERALSGANPENQPSQGSA